MPVQQVFEAKGENKPSCDQVSPFYYSIISFLLKPETLSSVQISRSVVADSLRPHEPQHTRPPLSITNSQSLLKLMSIKSEMPSNHLILYCPLLLLPSILPSIRVFSSESALRIRQPKYWSLNFNISPSKEHPGSVLQDGLFGSPCSRRDSQESSPTPQFKSTNSLALCFLYSPTLTSIHGHWKNHSLD